MKNASCLYAKGGTRIINLLWVVRRKQSLKGRHRKSLKHVAEGALVK